MGSKSDEPDYMGLAEQQGELNREANLNQTYANRPTQYTPWGYTSWQANPYTDPGSGEQVTRWEQTQGLTPELQEILNKQIALQGGRTDIAGGLTSRMANEFGTAMDWGGLTPLAQSPMQQYTMPESYEGVQGIGDPTRMRQRAENAFYDKGMSRLQPQFEGQGNALEVKMRNQGLGPEDEAWKANMEGLNNQQTDAYGQLQYDATRAGLGEQSQLWNQGLQGRQQGVSEANNQFNQALGSNAQNYQQNLQSANYANALRQQQMTEAMQQRGFSLNEINALLSGQQVNAPQMPNFATAQQAAPANVYQAGVDQGNFDQMTDPTGGLMSLAGTLGGGYLAGR